MNSLGAPELGSIKPDSSAINSSPDSTRNGSLSECVRKRGVWNLDQRERERSGSAKWEVVFVGLKSDKRVYLAFHFFKSL